ncbi:hypothetical protein FVEN_g7684 [Fusarium venenatum]|uniref:Cytochrome b5 heme-binding domain-containing protein n=1 Tax=Fusarium venenatum TaxID=56646 RepID=A0A2L2TS28_9HYPO|nr:uncharacterized protein FVRRES_08124 [Fusarium venenatum]KAG8354384.1 hypothetical protein FVEN_g7684 [Fusarium venenatum]KAH6964910.1 acyl-CoA dehydrogenase/oxidase [Fusarium venenatum]CEI68047.1 unnamed protein product [Fusarium venenatum]
MFPSLPTFTRREVGEHTTISSLWCIINSTVYDLTDFIQDHPGGEQILLKVAGQDATSSFHTFHRQEVLTSYSHLAIGTITGEETKSLTSNLGDISPIPYAEPLWLRPQFCSPYYTDSHRRLQRAARIFTETYLIPEASRCERTGCPPSEELINLMADQNILRMRLGPGKHLHGQTIMGGGVVDGREFNYFHKLILAQEMCRPLARGFHDTNMAGMTIGLSVILNFARNSRWKTNIADQVFGGVKKLCLAITEAGAGSDVAGIQTRAEKTPDGKHYIVNGSKKWITNGMWSDYFVTLVKTGKGYSVLLIPRTEGVETRPIKTSYSSAAGTAYVTFDQVKIPSENLIGEENDGLRIIISNFNQERWAMACSTITQCRAVVEECLKWSNQRQIAGKRLNEQPVVRQKLAKMISHVEGAQAWLESITFQMCNMSLRDQTIHLAGPIALLKRTSTRMAQKIADEAVQIWGGRSLTQTGMGRYINDFYQTHKFDAILGGSEEVLAEVAMKLALKGFPRSML